MCVVTEARETVLRGGVLKGDAIGSTDATVGCRLVRLRGVATPERTVAPVAVVTPCAITSERVAERSATRPRIPLEGAFATAARTAPCVLLVTRGNCARGARLAVADVASVPARAPRVAAEGGRAVRLESATLVVRSALLATTVVRDDVEIDVAALLAGAAVIARLAALARELVVIECTAALERAT